MILIRLKKLCWDTEEACKKFLEVKYNCDKKEPKNVKHLKVYSKK